LCKAAARSGLIMKNGDHAIGLFQGIFDKNIVTFNPGWSSDAKPLSEFTDVRELQRQLKDLGVKMMTEADESPTGPASFMIVDPDANTIIEKSVSAVSGETLEVKAIRAWHSALRGAR
jgi:lactoylglutathione lyase